MRTPSFLLLAAMLGTLPQAEPLVPTTHRRPCRFHTRPCALPESLNDVAAELQGFTETFERAQRLVQLGDAWSADPSNAPMPSDKTVRVPGCVAVVHVAVEVGPGADGPAVQKVRGTADARLSQGLLAVLAQGLAGAPVHDVLELDPATLCAALGVSGAVTPSRANGFGSMVTTVQTLLQQQLSAAQAGEANEEQALAQNLWSGVGGGEEVAVLLSGGVDSSVALRLVQEAGYTPRAFYLKIWLEDELAHLNQCPWEDDWQYASAVAKQAKVPLEAVSMQREYWDRVVHETIEEARLGRTPNPDILCNSRVKFGMFYEHVGQHFAKVVTGHYARVAPVCPHDEDDLITERSGVGDVALLRSPDLVKDQTYFLSSLSQQQLRAAHFPIGEFEKSRVREMATAWDLPTMARKDSQGICFLGKLKWDDFMHHYLGESPGDVREIETGQVLGQHRGLHFHTIGQRRGIGRVLRATEVNRGPWYVVAKDVDSNTLFVTTRYQDIVGPRSRFQVDRVSWVSGSTPPALAHPGGSLDLVIQVRHGAKTHAGVVTRTADPGQVLQVDLAERDSGLAPGQYAAFYHGRRCLGSGVIRETPLDELSGVAAGAAPVGASASSGPRHVHLHVDL